MNKYFNPDIITGDGVDSEPMAIELKGAPEFYIALHALTMMPHSLTEVEHERVSKTTKIVMAGINQDRGNHGSEVTAMFDGSEASILYGALKQLANNSSPYMKDKKSAAEAILNTATTLSNSSSLLVGIPEDLTA